MKEGRREFRGAGIPVVVDFVVVFLLISMLSLLSAKGTDYIQLAL